ncbi:YdeI/OmpD-associated family protein [Spongiimicrobium salis]|uniref:YdeI/OmpD-associated family protein n=1 Tax=Spongiimicrobium salis TaxID=1667022 RepID=UPI00374D4AAF
MDVNTKIAAYYEKPHPYKEGIAVLRSLIKQTELVETYKWNFPVYTIQNKNIIGICRFSQHFGIWFFNGALLTDPKKVLQNAQEGKTKNMRHWKFIHMDDINSEEVLAYIEEAIANQKKGILPEKKAVSKPTKPVIPALLNTVLAGNSEIEKAFFSLSPYKQKEYCEYISEAKQEKTKQSRLKKITPMILEGKGLNDKYR